MKKKKTLIADLSIFLSLLLAGCFGVQAADLTSGIKAQNIVVETDIAGQEADIITDFAVELFQHSAQTGQNTLISPYSVLNALAMTANGAEGETLAQMEAVFGLPMDQLNPYLLAYTRSLPSDKKYQLNVANSIWFKDDASFSVERDFLQTNADYYGANLYKAPFTNATVNDVNAWVKDNTQGMIPKILSDLPQDTVMLLINALAFDAEWQEIYKETQVDKGVFTREDKTQQSVDFMYSEENRYLEDQQAVGLLKYYAGRKYAFAALLPNEGVSVADYIAGLDGDRLHTMLSQARQVKVRAAIPKFSYEYTVEMNSILAGMGMEDAFQPNGADFSRLGYSDVGNLYISQVLHKTFIAVDEKGTKAGAATAVSMAPTALPPPEEIKTVYLDRPFVFLIIDCEAQLPLFMGTVMEIDK